LQLLLLLVQHHLRVQELPVAAAAVELHLLLLLL
jgi:hypothetical protein